jgi:hypothetical protein
VGGGGAAGICHHILPQGNVLMLTLAGVTCILYLDKISPLHPFLLSLFQFIICLTFFTSSLTNSSNSKDFMIIVIFSFLL